MKLFMGYNSVVLDSSVLVALFDINDSQHDKAIRLFETLQKKHVSLLVHPLCVVEILTVLKYKLDKHALQQAFNTIFDDEIFIRDSVMLRFLEKDDTIVTFLHEKDISVVDSVLIFYSLQKHAELITFDQHLIKAYRSILRSHT